MHINITGSRSLLYLLVSKADVLRFENLSVGCFAANDHIQLVHRLYHSPNQAIERGHKHSRTYYYNRWELSLTIFQLSTVLLFQPGLDNLLARQPRLCGIESGANLANTT